MIFIFLQKYCFASPFVSRYRTNHILHSICASLPPFLKRKVSENAEAHLHWQQSSRDEDKEEKNSQCPSKSPISFHHQPGSTLSHLQNSSFVFIDWAYINRKSLHHSLDSASNPNVFLYTSGVLSFLLERKNKQTTPLFSLPGISLI